MRKRTASNATLSKMHYEERNNQSGACTSCDRKVGAGCLRSQIRGRRLLTFLDSGEQTTAARCKCWQNACFYKPFATNPRCAEENTSCKNQLSLTRARTTA